MATPSHNGVVERRAVTSVFLTYAREDKPFVRRLHEALKAAGHDPTWDQDHQVIPFSSLYQREISEAIVGSEKFIFVISPDSLDSEPCAFELTEALAAGKQVIPLLRRVVRNGQMIPAAIADRNWIFFDQDDQFDLGFIQLVATLETDLAFVQMHKRIQVHASEWADGRSDRPGCCAERIFAPPKHGSLQPTNTGRHP
jgi:hypothetical protein